MNTSRPAMGLLAALGALGLCSAALMPSNPQDEWTSSSLKHRAIGDFDYVLGQEKWRTLGSEIELFGAEFPLDVLGPMRFEIDSNGDGQPDEDVKGATGFVDLKGKNEDGEVFHYGVRFKNDGERKWSWTSSGAMVGKVQGTTIAIIDANADGDYDDYGVDGIVLGNKRGAAYVSRVVNIGGDLFDFEISSDGTSVKTKPYQGETGILKLEKIKGVKAEVVTAIVKQGKDISFQLTGQKKGVKVPVGKYAFADAFLERGSETARIRAGRMAKLELEASQEIPISFGGPLVGEVPAPTVRGGKATISPAVQIFGKSGEEYYDFQPKGAVPSYELYDANTGKRLKKGKFPAG